MSVSFKELYDVYLKATYPMEIGKRKFEVGEPVAHLDRIQTSGLQEVNEYVTAHGGFADATRIIWNTTKELRINFRGHVMHSDRDRFRSHFPDFRGRIKGQMQQVKIIFAHGPIKKETVDPEKQLFGP